MSETGISLKMILLLEAAVLLVALILFLGFLCWHFRQRFKEACEKYLQLKAEYIALKQKSQQQHQPASGQELVIAYLDKEINSATSRFDQHLKTSPPTVADNHPLGANVAALRHLYLNCEKEFLQTKDNAFSGWAFFEKRLAELVRRFANNKSHQQKIRSSRTRLLQERIDALTPFEAENKQLLRKLQQAEKRQKQLETAEREGRKLIAQFKKMLAELQPGEAPGTAAASTTTAAQQLAADYGSLPSTAFDQLDIYTEQLNRVGKQLADEVASSDYGFNQDEQQKLKATINSLEMELFKTNMQLTELHKQLKESRAEMHSQAAELHNTQEDMRTQAKKMALQDGILHVTLPETEQAPPPTQNLTTADYFNPHKILAEIRQLRENNKAQRYIIIALQTQIESLKESIAATDNLATKELQEQKVMQLERMVKEFQLCVETLESEVDNLYNQLQEKINHASAIAAQPEDAATTEAAGHPNQQAMEQELEQLKTKFEQAIKQFRLSQILNQFAQQLVNCNKMDDVAKLCIQLLRDWQTLAGFCLQSTLGNAEYFGAKVFSDEEKKLVRSNTQREPVTKTKSGLIFYSDKMRLLLSQPPTDEQLLAQLIKGYTQVVNLVSSQLAHLELEKNHTGNNINLDNWAKTTKSHLSNLDIQYAYFIEESRNTFESLSSELKQAIQALGLKGGTQAVLENALNEYQSRMQLLLSTGAVVDREISHLLEHMSTVNPTQ